ncbi:dienelactone hydrolase family protein [Ralstonia syzygii subsp. celebesensis]|uniref:Dienelactone hydrolase family protein n=3 Tax=Ralstonia solanacearum species complex TaxID=3116862 RepID=A0AAD0WHL3_RALSL|nr:MULTISPECIES: dienelactone hydrolase family protein [Ralstonia solanacearum species complex]AQW30283.1 dienelactone hydrolase [blood disease bacterium A2-HR MARDI]AXV82971.1 dienelactone hydrolase family protein [Ralstonia solanacearum]AXW54087.1 dienelactone hydrolase family protein [Ralstonia solanacearum]
MRPQRAVMRPVRHASRALSRGLAGALLAASALAFAQPTPDAGGTQPDMPAARAPSAAQLGVQTVQIPRAVMKDAEDAPQTLTAYWIAPGRKGPAAGAPVVIALHGCGGLYTPAGADANALGERYRGYAQWLAARGYAVVLPDSFGPRGKPHGICTEPTAGRSINGTVRRADILATLRWIATQPGLDARRIVLLGWSNGAQAVLDTVDASRAWPADTPAVERAVAFYPGCLAALQRPAYQLNAPLMLLAGANDDWTPADRCQALQTAVLARQPQARFELEMFGGAYHGFDGTAPLEQRRGIPNGVRHGTVTVGGDPAAREAAFTRLAAWLDNPHP